MEVKIMKLDPNAVIPEYQLDGDAGLDLTTIHHNYDEYGNVIYHTGLAVEIPEGYVGLVFPRSSVSKTSLTLANSVGVIDSNYRGEIILKFKRVGFKTNLYNIGDRIAQLIILPYPKIEFKEVEELDATNRGSGGFGHTGN